MSKYYFNSGIAAVVLALLYPVYWSSLIVFGSIDGDFVRALKQDMMTLSSIDALFVVIGLLEVYIYFSLSKALDEQLNSKFSKIALLIMMICVLLFHSQVMIDIYLNFANSIMSHEAVESLISVSVIFSISALVVYTIAALGLCIFLMTKHQQISPLLKYFSGLLFVVCLFQISVFFAVVNLVMFPITLVVLALFFFKDPETLEVV